VLATIDKYGPTVFFAAPKIYAGILEIKDAEKKYNLTSLRLCISSLEALPKKSFISGRKVWTGILDGIGSTELMHIFISNRPGDVKAGKLR